jgi:hypothetical protein
MTEPIEAVFLGIDPAKHTSGAAILIPDYGETDQEPFQGNYVLHEFGKVLSQAERERYLLSLIDMAEELSLPAVVVAEIWDGPRSKKTMLENGSFGRILDQKWTYTTILGIGEGWGRWAAEIESANEHLKNEKLPEILLKRISPNDWRDQFFGKRRPRDSVAEKATACRYFHGVFGYSASDDIAEAGCIALVGTRDADIAAEIEVLRQAQRPKKRQKFKKAS